MSKASTNTAVGSQSACLATTVKSWSGTPVPETKRLGATLTKASPIAASSIASTIASSTRLRTSGVAVAPCIVASAGPGDTLT